MFVLSSSSLLWKGKMKRVQVRLVFEGFQKYVLRCDLDSGQKEADVC